jgi:hypothetical protein
MVCQIEVYWSEGVFSEEFREPCVKNCDVPIESVLANHPTPATKKIFSEVFSFC